MAMKTFYVGIKGVIIHDDKVLLLRADGGKGRRDIWEMPGGRIDDDETAQQALNRELNEELANITDISIGGVLHAARLPWDIDGTNSLVLIFYKVNANFEGDPKIGEEHMGWRWCTIEEARQLANDFTLPAIEAAFAVR